MNVCATTPIGMTHDRDFRRVLDRGDKSVGTSGDDKVDFVGE